jgi:hypothetical protein
MALSVPRVLPAIILLFCLAYTRAWSQTVTVGNITSPTTATAKVNFGFIGGPYRITADFTPTAFTATGLPNGFELETSTGWIYGSPTVAGTFAVTIGATSSTKSAQATLTLTVQKGFASLSIRETSVYDGTPRPALLQTHPAGLDFTVTYNGSATPPTEPGVYPAIATVVDANYEASWSFSYQVERARPVLTWNIPPSVAVGTPLAPIVATASASVVGTFEYFPLHLTPTELGPVRVSATFTPADTVHYHTLSWFKWIAIVDANDVSPRARIVLQPRGITLPEGYGYRFTVEAVGDPTPTIQWYRDGQPLAGETSTELWIYGNAPVVAGSYHAVATNAAGSDTSQTAVFTVIPAVPALFPAQTYLDRYPDVKASIGLDPNWIGLAWVHYYTIGLAAGRSPDGDFNPGEYLAQYPDLAAGTNGSHHAAAIHWYNSGRIEGRRIPSGFDATAYLLRYPDLQARFGTDRYGAWVYYRDEGIYDGEVFDEEFRVEEYLDLNVDLGNTFGTDLKAALMHWLTTGRTEGRLGRIPTGFDGAAYLARNPDLAAAFNGNLSLAWDHYWLYGIYEGRAFDDEFRVFEYLAINPDMLALFEHDWRAATLHWLRYGKGEGRLGRIPLIFSSTEYLNRYPSVATAWGTYPTTVWQHYWLYGVYEGRTFDEEFRADEYMTLNPDLAAVFNGDRRAAFMHWVRYGRAEGRDGRN